MKPAFVDVDTQIDFLYPAGALYVPGAERIVPNLAKLNRYASENGIPLISTVDAHAEDDPEFAAWPAHCVVGTVGQQKPAATLVPNQIVFEKQTTNCFLNPRLAPLLAELGASRYVVYGVVTEICVQFAATGLLATGKPVTLVTDAVKELNPETAREFLNQFKDAGGALATVEDIRVPSARP